MAIAQSILRQPAFEPPLGPLIKFYRRALLELKGTAVQRLVRDQRVLTAEARRARLLIREITGILNDLEGQRTVWIAENIPKAYLKGVRIANQGLSEIGYRATSAFDPNIHRAAIELLIADIQEDFGSADTEILKGARRVLRRTQLRAVTDKAITERIAQSTAQGSGRRALSKQIAQRLVDDYGEKPIRINGRSYKIGPYAELVARTKTREAASAGTINRVVEAGLDLVMITAHGAKDACGFWEGKVFSITGESERYPSLDTVPNAGPPFHPNCKHSLVPFVESLASGAERRRARGVPSASLGKSYGDVEKLVRNGELKVA